MTSLGDGLILEPLSSVTPGLATLHVLVVDDEPLIRWSVSETLAEAGHAVTEAADAASAVRALTTGPAPDVVLLDYRLPDSRDLRLLADIRRLAPSAAVVMMTACGENDVEQSAEALGACRVIDKPIDMRELDAIIRAAACLH